MAVARQDRWPGFTLSGAYADGGGFSPEKIVGVGVSFPLPVWNANGAGIEAGKFHHEAELQKYAFEKERTGRLLKAEFLRYEASRHAVRALPVAKLGEIEAEMAGTDQGFRRGHVDLLTYIEADSQHSETLDAIYDAQVEFATTTSHLLSSMGDDALPLEK